MRRPRRPAPPLCSKEYSPSNEVSCNCDLSSTSFSGLCGGIGGTDFSSGGFSLVRITDLNYCCSYTRIIEVVGVFPFSSRRLGTLGVVTPRVISLRGANLVCGMFDFSDRGSGTRRVVEGDGWVE